MSHKRLLSCVFATLLLAISASGFENVPYADSIVELDTVVTAGDYTVSCKAVYKNVENATMSIVDSAYIFTDSIGRPIETWNKSRSIMHGSGTVTSSNLLLDSTGKVSALVYDRHSWVGGGAHSEYTHDSLAGVKWNSKGMILSGILFHSDSAIGDHPSVYEVDTLKVSLVYDCDDIAVIDTVIHIGSIPDTVIMAGEYPVGCSIAIQDSVVGRISSKKAEYRDTLGRVIYSVDEVKETEGRGRSRTTSLAILGSDDRVKQMITKKTSVSGDKSFRSCDTLVGERWNENGLIESGTLFSNDTSYTAGNIVEVTESEEEVRFFYDDANLNVIDVFYESQQTSLSESQSTAKAISVRTVSRSIELTGAPAGESISLFTANGRLIFEGVSDQSGAAIIEMNSLPAGIYLLNVNRRSFKLLNK